MKRRTPEALYSLAVQGHRKARKAGSKNLHIWAKRMRSAWMLWKVWS